MLPQDGDLHLDYAYESIIPGIKLLLFKGEKSLTVRQVKNRIESATKQFYKLCK